MNGLAVRNNSIYQEYKNGCTYEELSVKYKMHTKSIYHIVSNISPGSKRIYNSNPKARNIQIHKEYAEGSTYEELSIKYNLKVNSIRSIVCVNNPHRIGNKDEPDPINDYSKPLLTIGSKIILRHYLHGEDTGKKQWTVKKLYATYALLSNGLYNECFSYFDIWSQMHSSSKK